MEKTEKTMLYIALILSIISVTSDIMTSSGISFNGSQVDLNGSNMFNGTISNYSTLGFMNDSLNLKVNKSGDNMTGKLTMWGNFTNRVSLMDGNGIFTAYNNSVIRTQLSATGIQEWKIANATAEVGYILYSAPGAPGTVGIIFRNASQGQRTQISLRPFESGGGLELYSSNTSGGGTNLTRILDQRDGGAMQLDYLKGTGNAYVCVNSVGVLYRGSPAC